MMLNYKKIIGDKVEGIECFERSVLPKKVLREKMAKLIENDFSKSNISSTIKLFKTFSDNECVTAVIAILEHVKPNQEVPNIYKILLKVFFKLRQELFQLFDKDLDMAHQYWTSSWHQFEFSLRPTPH